MFAEGFCCFSTRLWRELRVNRGGASVLRVKLESKTDADTKCGFLGDLVADNLYL